MELTDARAYLSLIKTEERRRAELLPDHPDAAYDQWLFYDAPFVNELCIVFLVALRHHIERRLTFLAACAADAGRPTTRQEFSTRMKELSDLKNARWEEIGRRLHQNQCAHHQVIEALRHLANAYKHDPRMEPGVKLLNHLRLDLNLRYAPIPESGKLQGGLATVVDLPADSSYPDIAASFVECVQGFLDDVEARNAISRVRGAGFHISTSDIDSRAFATNN
jgi:hypothetical protein